MFCRTLVDQIRANETRLVTLEQPRFNRGSLLAQPGPSGEGRRTDLREQVAAALPSSLDDESQVKALLVIVQAPAVAKAPDVAQVPAVGQVLAEAQASVVRQAPTVHQAPVTAQAPAVGQAQVMQQATAVRARHARQKRRRPMSEKLRENHKIYNDLMHKKMLKILRELDLSSNSETGDV